MKRISQHFDELILYLSSIENLICVIIFANSIVALIENIFVWIRSRDFIEIAVVNSLEYFFNSVLVIISGFITATFKTLNHILIYFIVNVAFILRTYYGYFRTKFSSSMAFIVLKAIFLLLILLIVIIWLCRERKNLFVIVNSNRIMNTEIKEIYKWYHLQLTSCHIQILVAMFSEFTYISLLVTKYGYNVENPFEILKYLPWPNILSCIIALIMIKGVREESNRIMIIFYIANCILVIYFICALTVTIESILLTLKEYKENYDYYKYIIELEIDIVLCVISYFITVITMINSIICHKNFGKGLKEYLLKEELKPFRESYDYKDDLDNLYHERNKRNDP
ncbi:unnamed protein product [Rhizophagus irregularis]|uniref:Uncharacterized protein n=1 Tax=Rhizophagus irregularis TaxID=588596 RepID=A0A2I1E6H2_9GLOM|nr:hypothetical protein RhiirB3_522196 [Rhizophagus irregularis]CAB4463955.1 unnamed protein product [Rhizophagus irregularis]CAB5308977.1 unnamed protein product [Rhizophagus irregularis]